MRVLLSVLAALALLPYALWGMVFTVVVLLLLVERL